MRRWILAAAGLPFLVLPGCGSDPEGPQEVDTQITVEVDWPLAREPGFVNARWRVFRLDAVPDSFAYRRVLVGEGDIGSGGTATARFTVRCTPGVALHFPPIHEMEVVGHFTEYEIPDQDEDTYWCRRNNVHPVDSPSFRCTDEPQVAEIQPPVAQLGNFTPPDS